MHMCRHHPGGPGLAVCLVQSHPVLAQWLCSAGAAHMEAGASSLLRTEHATHPHASCYASQSLDVTSSWPALWPGTACVLQLPPLVKSRWPSTTVCLLT